MILTGKEKAYIENDIVATHEFKYKNAWQQLKETIEEIKQYNDYNEETKNFIEFLCNYILALEKEMEMEE